MCDRAYPPQQQKHAMNSIRDNKTNEDFAVQEVVPVVMETVQNKVQQHGLEWVGILQARDGYTSLTITTSNIFQSLSHLTHHHQTCITTHIPPTPHTILSHTAPLILQRLHALHPLTPNITSTLQYPYTPTPCQSSPTPQHHLHPIPIRPSNILHPSNLYHTPQYPYTPSNPLHTLQHPTRPNTHTHPPTLYTPSNTLHTLHTLQHPTHPPTVSYTTSPLQCPKHTI